MLKRTDQQTPAEAAFGASKVEYDSPAVADVVVIEEFPGEPSNYKALPYGTPHPNNAESGLDLKLVWQGPVKMTNNQVRIYRVYATRESVPDWYNYVVKYSENANSAPIFIRTYRELRSEYVPGVKGQPFTGIVLVAVTASGIGYTSDPTVAIMGSGVLATARPIRDLKAGTIVGLELLTSGKNYAGESEITFTGGGGSGAVGKAATMPGNAYLVKEEMNKLDGKMAALFVSVTRVYETLPGPWVYSTRTGPNRKIISVKKRRQLTGAITPSDTIEAGLWTNVIKGDGDAIVAEEIIETEMLFPALEVGIDVPDPVPADFRDLAPTVTRAVTEEGQVEDPPILGLGEISHRETQETDFTKRTQTTGRDVTQLPKEIVNQKTSGVYGFGGVLEEVRRLDRVEQVVDQGVRVVESSVRHLPGGLTLKETTKLPGNGTGFIEVIIPGSGYSTPPAVSFSDGATPGGATATAVMVTVQNSTNLDVGGDFPLTLVTPGDANGVLYFLGARSNGGVWSNPQLAGLAGDGISMQWTVGTSPYNFDSGLHYTGAQLAGLASRADDTNLSLLDQWINTDGTKVKNGQLVIDLGPGRELEAAQITLKTDSTSNPNLLNQVVQVHGSHDGLNWGLLGTVNLSDTNQTWATASLDTLSSRWRYFRLRRATIGDYYTQQLRIQEIELYGTLHIVPAKDLSWAYNGDANGVFNFLGQLGAHGPWRNPQTNGDIVISSSGLQNGSYDAIVDRQPSDIWLTPMPGANIVFDLGEGRALGCSRVSFRQRVLTQSPTARLFIEGSNDGMAWANGFVFNVGTAANSWSSTAILPRNQLPPSLVQIAYRYFRITIVTPQQFFSLGEIELYGTLTIAPAAVTPTEVLLDSVVVTAGGTYITAPDVVFTGGGGTGATAIAELDGLGAVARVRVTHRGTGFTSAPAVSFTGGVGSAAAAHAIIGKSIDSVVVTSGGSGYTTPPLVRFGPSMSEGVAGGGASAIAILGNGLASATVDLPGSGYTTPPTVALASAEGMGGAITAVLGFGLAAIAVTAPGTGFTAEPSVRITGNGTGAIARAILGRQLTTPVVSAAGTGYTSAPAVAFAGGGGTGAAGTAVIGFPIASAAQVNGGLYYTSAPAVTIVGGGGAGAHGVAKLEVAISAVNVTAPGTGYTSTPTVAITGGGGTGATASAVRGFGVASAAVGAGGSGYATPPTVVFTGDGTGATGTAVLTAGVVTSITIDNPGTGYTTAPTMSLTGGGGSGATATATLATTGTVKSVTLTSPGTGFTTEPTVALTGGGGTGATVTLTFGLTGKVGSIELIDAGSGYTSPPIINLAGGGGTGAAFTATLDTVGGLQSILMSDFGSGYTSAPTISLTGGAGTGASAVIDVGAEGTTISAVVIIEPGTGYTTAPTIDFIGTGSGATATATLAATGSVKALTIAAAGSGYSAPPTLTISGGGGTGATGRAFLLATGGSVARVVINSGGESYLNAAVPSVSFIGGGGTGAAGVAVLAATGPIVAIILDVAGSYATAPVVTIAPPGAGITATAIYHLSLGTGWGILFQTVTDETTGISVLIKKEIVEAGTRKEGIGFIDINTVDVWRSIRLTSTVVAATIPQPETYSSWEHYQFPPTLLAIIGVFNNQSTTIRAGQNYDGTFQTTSDSRSDSASAYIKIKHGYRGPCRAEIERIYMKGPPNCSNLPEPFLVQESSGTVVFKRSSASLATQDRPKSVFSVGTAPPIDFNLSTTVSSGGGTSMVAIGPFLTGDFVGVQNPGNAAANVSVELAPSTPLKFVPGTSFISEVRVTKMRLNLFMIEKIRLYVPPAPCNIPPPPHVGS